VITGFGEVWIEAPPEAVFDYLADARNEPAWLPGARSVTKATDGPVGLHTRFEGEYARAGKVDLELVRFERPRALTIRAHSRMLDFDDAVELAPDGNGTRLTARLTGSPTGLMRVLTPMIARTMTRQFGENWIHLKRALESP
jgi:carbon monoxide dehydrogenase subunit G